MKKLLLSILLTLLPLLASAETVEIDGILYNIVTKGNYAEVVRKFSGKYSGDITIPEKVKYEGVECIVTKIGDNAFANCVGLTSVTIPVSVTSIGTKAFEGCSLTSIIIPNNVTSIGSYAFRYCSELTSATLGQSVTFIGNNAFDGCYNLTSANIPNGVTKIGNSVFYSCRLTSVIIPNSVTTIGSSAFSGCDFTSITIPKSVTSIESTAFAFCEKLSDVYSLPEQVREGSWSGDGLYTQESAFSESYPEFITLHVPAASIDAYRSTAPWSKFKAIVALEDGDKPKIEKCATPEISYENGRVKFTCETQDVEYISSVTLADEHNYYDDEIQLSQKYKITVYATKAGYENSNVSTREIVIENGPTTLFGDLNKDGKVNVADHVKLSDIIMNK